MLPPPLCAVADVVIGLLVDPTPGSTVPGGVLGLAEPDLSVLAWAVLQSEGEGRPMLKSKMAHFAGLPRATLYRKLDELSAVDLVETDTLGRVRVSQDYLASDTFGRALLHAGRVVRSFGSKAGQEVPPCGEDGGSAASRLRKAVLIGRLVVDLARLSHCHADTWFSAQARYWVVRWLVLQAQGRGRPATPAELSRRTGLSRGTVHRQIAQIERLGALSRGFDRSLEIDPALYDRPALQMTIHVMQNKIFDTIHRLSELDTYCVEEL